MWAGGPAHERSRLDEESGGQPHPRGPHHLRVLVNLPHELGEDNVITVRAQRTDMRAEVLLSGVVRRKSEVIGARLEPHLIENPAGQMGMRERARGDTLDPHLLAASGVPE